MTLEIGKNWGEADSEFAAAIDFLEFYVTSALEVDQATTPIQFPGERNQVNDTPPATSLPSPLPTSIYRSTRSSAAALTTYGRDLQRVHRTAGAGAPRVPGRQPVPEPQVYGRDGGAHPFGGFKLSGMKSKAGGADYLHHFTQAKSIAERILG